MSKLDLGLSEHRLAFVLRFSNNTLGELMHISNEIVDSQPGTIRWPGEPGWTGVTSLCMLVAVPRPSNKVAWMLLERWDYWFEQGTQLSNQGMPRRICVDCFLELLT